MCYETDIKSHNSRQPLNGNCWALVLRWGYIRGTFKISYAVLIWGSLVLYRASRLDHWYFSIISFDVSKQTMTRRVTLKDTVFPWCLFRHHKNALDEMNFRRQLLLRLPESYCCCADLLEAERLPVQERSLLSSKYLMLLAFRNSKCWGTWIKKESGRNIKITQVETLATWLRVSSAMSTARLSYSGCCCWWWCCCRGSSSRKCDIWSGADVETTATSHASLAAGCTQLDSDHNLAYQHTFIHCASRFIQEHTVPFKKQANRALI